jgi:DNA modification methylase
MNPEEPVPMTQVARAEYQEFVATHKRVSIEETEVEIGSPWKITALGPSREYTPETTTVWSFPDRGDWATHTGNYRGNWSPFIPRNLILRYTKPGELVIDQMLGSGTTIVECKVLGRNGIGVDVNPEALMVAFDRLNFQCRPLDEEYKEPIIDLFHGDARNLNLLKDDSVDLVATHPPYAGIIRYTGERVPGDLSALKLEPYFAEMRKVAAEAYRVTKPGKHCAILIGDTRQHKHYVPISVRILQVFLDAGFILREDIIKLQHKMKSTRQKWAGSTYDFYLIAHEHLYVFRKPEADERLSEYRHSVRWW